MTKQAAKITLPQIAEELDKLGFGEESRSFRLILQTLFDRMELRKLNMTPASLVEHFADANQVVIAEMINYVPQPERDLVGMAIANTKNIEAQSALVDAIDKKFFSPRLNDKILQKLVKNENQRARIYAAANFLEFRQPYTKKTISASFDDPCPLGGLYWYGSETIIG